MLAPVREQFAAALTGLVILCGVLLIACSSPTDTVIPSDPAQWDDQLRGSIDRLSSTDRQLAVSYLDRTKSTAALGGRAVPTGVTLGQAIDAQRAFDRDQAQQRLTNRGQQEQRDQQRKDAEQRAAGVFKVALVGKQITP